MINIGVILILPINGLYCELLNVFLESIRFAAQPAL